MNGWKRNLPLFISIVISVIAFLFGCFWDPLSLKEYSAIPAFLFSVVSLLIGQIIGVQYEVNKVSDDSDRVCLTIRQYIHVVKVGTPKKAWKYIMDRLSVLDYVQNTSFNFEDEIEKTQHRLYKDDSYEKAGKKIAFYVSKGLQWQDVGDESSIARFKAIEEHIAEKTKGEYIFRLIAQDIPQIGFILLTYKDGTKEVLFNWDFRDIPQDPTVLLSQDKDIFDMFAAQFNSLWKIASIPYDNTATKSTS